MVRVLSLFCVALLSNALVEFTTTGFAQEAAADAVVQAANRAPAINSIDQAMQVYVDSGVISGAVTLVGHKGKIIHLGAVGLADIEAAKPMKPFNMFAIASMTKPITATAVMLLQEEGKLNVQDNVSKYIPAFKDVKLSDGSSPEREITIRDCLTHTAGLAGEQVFQGSLQSAVEELATRPLAFQPGTQWKYSPGLNVAGRIVEIVSEQPFDVFLQERIFAPADMTSTTFFPDQKQQRRIALLYGPGENGSGENKHSLMVAQNHIANPGSVKAPNPSGGLFATARDLFRFYQMILNDGKLAKQQIVDADSVAQMTSPQTGTLETGFTPGNCWGLGWCIVREPQGVTESLSSGTFGHGGAFGTQGWVDPSTETIYVLMIQRTKMGNSDGSEIRKAFHRSAVDAIAN